MILTVILTMNVKTHLCLLLLGAVLMEEGLLQSLVPMVSCIYVKDTDGIELILSNLHSLIRKVDC